MKKREGPTFERVALQEVTLVPKHGCHMIEKDVE